VLSCAEALIGPGVCLACEGKAERAVQVLAQVLETGTYSMPARGTAHRLLDELRSGLSPAAFNAAQERGRALDLWATVKELLAEWVAEDEERPA
jgi:hypothetical protein